jgi:trimeric autotransporter adhesin
MSSARSRRKLQVIGSLSILLLVALAIGCNGFFVDPKLVSMSVQTTSSKNLVNVGDTVQLQATGTYDDGSTKNFTGKAVWSVTSNPDFVKVNASGLVTALKVSPAGTIATVQAAAQSSSGSVVSGSADITLGTSSGGTITLGCTSSFCSGNTISISQNNGNPVTFTATQNGTDVTTQATWQSSAQSMLSLPVTTTTSPISGTLGTTTGNVTITATVGSSNGTLILTITQ